MSNRWPAGIIRRTPVTPTGPLQNGAASGVWSLADAAYWTKQGLWPLAGNFLAVEDVFSTYLYTGNGSTQTITNGIDVSGSGGLVWIKKRNASESHFLVNSASPGFRLETDGTGAQGSQSVLSLTSSGFSLLLGNAAVNGSGSTYASWTFREQPNFFDIVTYTGTGANRNIAHNLGSVPGMIIVKRTSTSGNDWQVYHRSLANTQYIALNTTAAVATGATRWNSTTPTATEFTVGTDNSVNNNGSTYVAYLYAHDTASTGLIQCGSFTTDGSGNVANQNLGWEPQWILLKTSSTTQGWILADNMRGWSYNSTQGLFANTSGAEFSNSPIVIPTANGFVGQNGQLLPSQTYIYVAIRRGPMRTPTLGTSVFLPLATSLAVDTAITTNFPVDLMISGQRNSNNATDNWAFIDRLRGATASTNTDGTPQKRIKSTSTNAEDSPTYPYAYNWWNTGLVQGYGLAGASQIYYTLRRAPGFFDEVCYTGTGVLGRTVAHNLGVAPEMMIFKRRSTANDWGVYHSALGNTKLIYLNYNLAPYTSPNWWNSTTPTASVFTVGDQNENNTNGSTYVGYLFASCPGVSKVGSYTGTGALQTVNCAFTTGARFVLIKRTDTTGDWYVWDSARGISSGTDPYLLLNDVSAEVTGTNYVDTDTTGFKVTAAAPAGINANGGSYIFLAIA
jgi:hypothetical protein